MKKKQLPKNVFYFRTNLPSSNAFNFTDNESEKSWEFNGVAYSGEVIKNHWWWGDLVFDLSTTTMRNGIPVLREHDTERIAGKVTSHHFENGLHVTGKLYKKRDDAKEIMDLSDDGHEWEMSVYIQPGKILRLKKDETTMVNGYQVTGPATVFQDNTIREVSFVTLGADNQTSATAFSDAQAFNDASDLGIEIIQLNHKAENMELEKQIASVTAERDALKNTVGTLEAKVTQLSAIIDERDLKEKENRIVSLFADHALELTEEKKEVFLNFSEEQLTAFEAEIKATKPKHPEYLFTDVATGQESSELDEKNIIETMIKM